MGIFSQGQDVYLFGGPEGVGYNGSMYIFNPSMAKEYPITDTQLLYDPGLLYKSSVKHEPMALPRVIQAKHKIYLFSAVFREYGPMKSLCSFQSFNPSKNLFCTLPTPSLDHSYLSCQDTGHLLVQDYIYLFIQGYRGLKDIEVLLAFSFNTRSSEWKEIESLLTEFEELKIPIPYDHYGDIGLSDKFSDNTQILVALNHGIPTAYHVWVGAAGSSLQPKSYRRLLEHNCGRKSMSHLLDIGGQRFCVIFSNRVTPLLVYTFKMNFAVEYENQGKSTSLAMPSIEILSSKKFTESVPLYYGPVYSVCLASAPASQSCFPCDEVEPSNKRNNNSNKREPGVVFLEV